MTSLPSRCPHFFGAHLVLQVDSRPRRPPFEGPDGADHVERIAVAGVGVGDHRDVHGQAAIRAGVVDHLVIVSSPTSGRPIQGRGGAEAGGVRPPGIRPPRPAGRPAGLETPQAPGWSGRSPAVPAAAPPAGAPRQPGRHRASLVPAGERRAREDPCTRRGIPPGPGDPIPDSGIHPSGLRGVTSPASAWKNSLEYSAPSRPGPLRAGGRERRPDSLQRHAEVPEPADDLCGRDLTGPVQPVTRCLVDVRRLQQAYLVVMTQRLDV